MSCEKAIVSNFHLLDVKRRGASSLADDSSIKVSTEDLHYIGKSIYNDIFDVDKKTEVERRPYPLVMALTRLRRCLMSHRPTKRLYIELLEDVVSEIENAEVTAKEKHHIYTTMVQHLFNKQKNAENKPERRLIGQLIYKLIDVAKFTSNGYEFPDIHSFKLAVCASLRQGDLTRASENYEKFKKKYNFTDTIAMMKIRIDLNFELDNIEEVERLFEEAVKMYDSIDQTQFETQGVQYLKWDMGAIFRNTLFMFSMDRDYANKGVRVFNMMERRGILVNRSYEFLVKCYQRMEDIDCDKVLELTEVAPEAQRTIMFYNQCLQCVVTNFRSEKDNEAELALALERVELLKAKIKEDRLEPNSTSINSLCYMFVGVDEEKLRELIENNTLFSREDPRILQNLVKHYLYEKKYEDALRVAEVIRECFTVRTMKTNQISQLLELYLRADTKQSFEACVELLKEYKRLAFTDPHRQLSLKPYSAQLLTAYDNAKTESAALDYIFSSLL